MTRFCESGHLAPVLMLIVSFYLLNRSQVADVTLTRYPKIRPKFGRLVSIQPRAISQSVFSAILPEWQDRGGASRLMGNAKLPLYSLNVAPMAPDGVERGAQTTRRPVTIGESACH